MKRPYFFETTKKNGLFQTTKKKWSFQVPGQRSRFLYSLLGGLVQGRLVGVLKRVDKFNGYEALRQLLGNCQPRARNRTMNLLQGIMAYPPFNMKSSLLPQILMLEEHFTQYERLGGGKLTTRSGSPF